MDIYKVDRTLDELALTLHQNAVDKGFFDREETDDQFIERTCNNMHDEISELHEAWRNGNLRAPCDKASKMIEAGLVGLTCLEEELADIVIRAFDTAARMGVSIGTAVQQKHLYNTTRPYRHGNKKS